MPLKQSMTIIAVVLVGCFLTSLTGIATVMLVKGWTKEGGLVEFFYRLSVGYPASCVVVVIVFPLLIPILTKFIDAK
jgi:hypothetical protein